MSGRGMTGFDAGRRAIPRRMYLRMLPPCLISSLTLALANIADALVVGNRVGELGLATIGLATPVYLIYSLLGTGFASGGAITHARLTAAEERENALAHCRRLSAELLALCEKKIIIPMRPDSESLNAAAAASVLMWEMAR